MSPSSRLRPRRLACDRIAPQPRDGAAHNRNVVQPEEDIRQRGASPKPTTVVIVVRIDGDDCAHQRVVPRARSNPIAPPIDSPTMTASLIPRVSRKSRPLPTRTARANTPDRECPSSHGLGSPTRRPESARRVRDDLLEHVQLSPKGCGAGRSVLRLPAVTYRSFIPLTSTHLTRIVGPSRRPAEWVERTGTPRRDRRGQGQPRLRPRRLFQWTTASSLRISVIETSDRCMCIY